MQCSNDTPQSGPVATAAPPALESCRDAAKRMGVKSMGYFYHVVKRDGLRIVKVGERASAVVSADVDAWIGGKIAAAAPVHTSAQGGRHV